MGGDYVPSSTRSNVPPSYPAKVPSSPSTAIMTDTDMSDPTYHGSSDMGGSGAEDSSGAEEDDGDKDGDKDGHAHAGSFLFFSWHTCT